MPESNMFSYFDGASRSVHYGHCGKRFCPEPLENLGRVMERRAFVRWINNGATVSDEAIANATDRLMNAAQAMIYEKQGYDIVVNMCKHIFTDLYENSGRQVKDIISQSWPQILNWAASHKGFENTLVSDKEFEEGIVTEFILFYTLRRTAPIRDIIKTLDDPKLSSN